MNLAWNVYHAWSWIVMHCYFCRAYPGHARKISHRRGLWDNAIMISGHVPFWSPFMLNMRPLLTWKFVTAKQLDEAANPIGTFPAWQEKLLGSLLPRKESKIEPDLHVCNVFSDSSSSPLTTITLINGSPSTLHLASFSTRLDTACQL